MSLSRGAFRFLPFAALGVLTAASAQQLESQVQGSALYDAMGYAVAPLGDLDGDGIVDLAVARPMDHVLAQGTGEVRALSGADLSVLWIRAGSLLGGDYGHALAPIGDLDGDGIADLLVGAPDLDDTGGHDSGTEGRVEVLSGATGKGIHLLLGDVAYDMFGQDVTALGDVDGDGVDDFAAGAPGDNHGAVDAGSVRVDSGASGATLYTVRGVQAAGMLGNAVECPGDLDGDGAGDLLVGAFLYDGPGADSGAVFLYSGVNGALLGSVLGPQAGAHFGVSIAATGDVDLDGTPDFAVGAPEANGAGSSSGGVFVYSGATRELLFAKLGQHASDYLGRSLAGIGDVNLDGRPDLLVGASLADVYGSYSGAAYVLSGVDGSELGMLFGEANSYLGTAVHGLGDMDGDGQPEIGVYASSVQSKGRLRIYSTEPPMPVASYCTGKVNSQSCLPILASTGTPTLSGADDFVLHVEHAINQKLGMVVWSRGLGTVPAFNSWLCLLPPIERTVASSSGGNGGPDDCSGVISFPFTHAYLQAKSLTAGTKVYAQGWFRDPAAAFGAGISTALVITVAP